MQRISLNYSKEVAFKMDLQKNFVTVSRMEFLLATVSTMWIGNFLAATTFVEFLSHFFHSLEGFSWYILAFLLAGQVNALSDYELDKKSKSHIPKAIDKMGKRRLKHIILLEGIIASFIAAHLSLALSKPLIAVLCFTGLFLGFGYSLEPIRLKKRGIFHSLTLMLIISIYPVLFGYFIIKDDLSLFAILVAGSIALLEYGVSLVTASRDYFEDLEMDAKTPAVILGPQKALKIATCLSAGSGTILVTSFVYTFALKNMLFSLSVLSIVLAFFVILTKQYKLVKNSQRAGITDLVKELKKRGNEYRLWPAVLKFPILVTSALLMV